jgi:predicted ATPase
MADSGLGLLPSSTLNLYSHPVDEYTFKHALTHEGAYGSMLQERRRGLHARIVASLEAGDHVTEQGEHLAHHALRGEVWDKALAYCRQRDNTDVITHC